MKEIKKDIFVDLPEDKKMIKYLDFLKENIDSSLSNDNDKSMFNNWIEELKIYVTMQSSKSNELTSLKNKYFTLVDLSSKQMLATLEKKQYE